MDSSPERSMDDDTTQQNDIVDSVTESDGSEQVVSQSRPVTGSSLDSSPERSTDDTQENDEVDDSASESDGSEQVVSQSRPGTGSSSDRATDTQEYDSTDESDGTDNENSETGEAVDDSEMDADDELGNDDNSSRTAEDSFPERSTDDTQENDVVDSASESDVPQSRPETGSSSDRATDTQEYDSTDESVGTDGLDDSETTDHEENSETEEAAAVDDSEMDADDDGNGGDNSSRKAEDDQPAAPAASSTSTDPAGSGSDGNDAVSAASSSGRKRPRSQETQPPLKRFRCDDSKPGHASEDGDATTADERETESGTDELADKPEGSGSDDRGTEVPLSEIPGTSGQKRPRSPETQSPFKRFRSDASNPGHASEDDDGTTAAGRATVDDTSIILESGTDDLELSASDDRDTEMPLSEIPGTSGRKRPRSPETQPPPKRIRVDSSAGQPASNDGDTATAAGSETADPHTLEPGTDHTAGPAALGQQDADLSLSTDRERSTEEDVASSESQHGNRVAAGSDSIQDSDVEVFEVPGGTGDSSDGHTAEDDAAPANNPGKKSGKRSWCTIS